MAKTLTCRECASVIAPRRFFGLREPDWGAARCARSIHRWVDPVTGLWKETDATRAAVCRLGGLFDPIGCGPEGKLWNERIVK